MNSITTPAERQAADLSLRLTAALKTLQSRHGYTPGPGEWDIYTSGTRPDEVWVHLTYIWPLDTMSESQLEGLNAEADMAWVRLGGRLILELAQTSDGEGYLERTTNHYDEQMLVDGIRWSFYS